MATPNFINITSIIPGQIYASGIGTVLVGILTNAANSNSTLKIDNIRVSNTSSIIQSDVTLGISTVGAATTNNLISATTIPANSSLIVSDRDSGIYLLENQNLVAVATTANVLNVTVKYETIS